MGHARADVFRRHYMHQTVKVDTQSAYLGTVNQSDLIKSVGLMSKKRDPRAPVKLSAEELESHRDHPELAALLLQRSRLKTALRTECGSATGKAAKTLQPEQYIEYLKLNNRIGRVKKDLKRTALKDLRARWFDSVDHDEIKQQLKGEAASTFAYVKPEFGCPLRTQISGTFSSVEMMTPKACQWSDAVRALSALSSRKPKIHTSGSEGEGEEEGDLCPFCLHDDALRPADRFHPFHSIGTLRRHVSRAHSSTMTSLSPVPCPYVGCEYMLGQGGSLKNHLATVHSLNL